MSVRTIVVDDSPSMQKLIAAVLEGDPEIKVIGTAANPEEARKMIKALDPDVITLDIEMPGMNGLDFLERLMRLRPMPVVMISSWTRKGADATIAALEIGAFSCLPKPRMDDEAALQEMCDNVKAAAAAKTMIRQRRGAPAAPQEAPVRSGQGIKMPGLDVIAIGASTGGVEALTEVLTGFPADCPPTLVTQHMPEHFTRSFAERLNRLCGPTVEEASDGMPLRPGHVYIAPGAVGHLTVSGRTERICRIVAGELRSGHMPSVDVMFESVARAYGRKCAAALLTGMGSDGAEGMLALKNAGARTIAQDRATSLVYGMPAAAARIGAAKEILPINEIADALFGTRMEVNQNVCA
jgi:two-component system chemotaxis response regulator CheB